MSCNCFPNTPHLFGGEWASENQRRYRQFGDLWRSMLMFDTSGLPSGAKLQAATLSFVVNAANFNNAWGDALALVSAFPASNCHRLSRSPPDRRRSYRTTSARMNSGASRS